MVDLGLVCVNQLSGSMYRYGLENCLGMGLSLVRRTARKDGAYRAVGSAIYVITAAGVGENLDSNDIASTPTASPSPSPSPVHSTAVLCVSPISHHDMLHSNTLRPHKPVGTLLAQHSARPQLKGLILLQLVASETNRFRTSYILVQLRLHLLPSPSHTPCKAA